MTTAPSVRPPGVAARASRLPSTWSRRDPSSADRAVLAHPAHGGFRRILVLQPIAGPRSRSLFAHRSHGNRTRGRMEGSRLLNEPESFLGSAGCGAAGARIFLLA